MTSPTHHLLTLGNPSHAADAMDEPFAVLLYWAGRWCSEFTDFWFRLRDIRRLEADDTPAVIADPGPSTGALNHPIQAPSATPPG
jgi:hypothetical protein